MLVLSQTTFPAFSSSSLTPKVRYNKEPVFKIPRIAASQADKSCRNVGTLGLVIDVWPSPYCWESRCSHYWLKNTLWGGIGGGMYDCQTEGGRRGVEVSQEL